jgi:hypothetical protein
VQVSPGSAAFGGVATGSIGARTFVVRNSGGVPTGTLVTGLTGAGSAHFGVLDDSCAGEVLAPGLSCAVTVSFAPTTTGAKTASLTVSATPGGSATRTLSGTGLQPAALAMSPVQHGFGVRASGTSGGAVPFTVTNTGEVPSGVLATSLVGDDGDQFDTSSDTCDGATLAAGATCSVIVSFAPTTTGSKVAGLQVSGGPAGTATGLLTGTGAAPAQLAVSPEPHAYGGVPTGSSSSETFTVTNTGGVSTGTLAASLEGPNAGQFDVVDDTCQGVTLDADESCTVEVAFAPTTTGGKSATLLVSGTPGGTASASLSGTGQTPPPLTFSPAGWDFGPVAVFGIASKPFTVTNTSDGPVGPLTIYLTGPYANQFSASADTCTGNTLTAGASCTFTGNFTPTKTGAMSTVLRALTSAGEAGAATLSGTGANQAELYLQPWTPFGTVPVGGSVSRVLVLTNLGGAASGPVFVSQSDVSGQFMLSENTCHAHPLSGGASCSVKVTFTPAAPGGANTNVTFNASPGGIQTATMPATGA